MTIEIQTIEIIMPDTRSADEKLVDVLMADLMLGVQLTSKLNELKAGIETADDLAYAKGFYAACRIVAEMKG